MKIKLNSLEGTLDLVPDTGPYIYKLNPLTGCFNLTIEAVKYKQILNYIEGELELYPELVYSSVTGTGSITLNDVVELKKVLAYGNTNQGILPSGYTQLEYIESTGTQHINTDIILTDQHKVECEYQQSEAGRMRVFGGRVSSTSRAFTLGAGTDYNFLEYGWFNTTTASSIQLDLNKHQVVFDGKGRKLTYDETEIALSDSTFTSGDICSLFAIKGSNQYYYSTPLKVFTFKVWDENDGLIINLIPAKRDSDGKVGMYDLVTDTFYTNAGTGTFTAGPTVVPTPDNPIDIVSNNGVIKYNSTTGTIYADGVQETIGFYNPLPSGYTELEYIQSTGTQYIDTGITLDNNSGIDINYEIMSYGASGGAKVFGYTKDSNFSSDSFAIANKWASKLTFTFGYGTQKIQSTDSKYTAIGKHNIVFNNRILYFDNEQVTSFNDETFTTGNIAIGNMNTSTGVSETSITVRHREYTFTKDGDIVFRGIPAKRNSDGVIGMYDLVSNTFYINSGTDSFTAGPVAGVKVEMLNKIDTYEDVQSILDGVITRKVGIKVLDGTEGDWLLSSSTIYHQFSSRCITGNEPSVSYYSTIVPYGCTASTRADYQFGCYAGATNSLNFQMIGAKETLATVNDWTAYLATQYENGTPVIILYPLATPTTETVTAQPITAEGDVTISVLQASLPVNDLKILAEAIVKY